MTRQPLDREGILLESGTNEVEFIEFFLGPVSYGINVSKVQRVLARSSVKINRVAQAPYCALGLIHIHGKPVMLLDLKAALSIRPSAEPQDASRQLILVTTFNQLTTAFLIDGISKIHRTSWDNFVPISESVAHASSGGFSTGTVTLQDNIIIILDLERLMLSLFPRAATHQLGEATAAFRQGREDVSILYAEDSKMVRQMTERILRDAGYQKIISFENGADALLYLQELAQQAESEGRALQDEIDLILTDIEMPKMDGLTLCRQVKTVLAKDEPPKVIVYSSLINKEMAVKCASVGADAQLAKPEIEAIVQLIDEMCLAEKANA